MAMLVEACSSPNQTIGHVSKPKFRNKTYLTAADDVWIKKLFRNISTHWITDHWEETGKIKKLIQNYATIQSRFLANLVDIVVMLVLKNGKMNKKMEKQILM